jgi:siroheme synthase
VLILAATPIGNLGDASDRLRTALEDATIVAAEDTRTTVRLLQALGIQNRPRLVALHDHNEKQRAAEIVELAREDDVLLLSDAGMPTVSDPGFAVVAEAAARGVDVTALPGPSAVITALALAGPPLPGDTRAPLLSAAGARGAQSLPEAAAATAAARPQSASAEPDPMRTLFPPVTSEPGGCLFPGTHGGPGRERKKG